MGDIFDIFKKIEPPAVKDALAPVSFIVAGLGNPGKEYEKTRHNAGFAAIDAICARFGARVDRMKFSALCGDLMIGSTRILLLKPQTFMNSSGVAVREASSFYKIPPEKIIVLSDDVCLPVGKLRVRRKGSAGGHNGLKSIIEELGSEAFPRIKIGVGEKPALYDMADWVLSRPSKTDLSSIAEATEKIPDCLTLLLSGDFEQAMMKYN